MFHRCEASMLRSFNAAMLHVATFNSTQNIGKAFINIAQHSRLSQMGNFIFFVSSFVERVHVHGFLVMNARLAQIEIFALDGKIFLPRKSSCGRQVKKNGNYGIKLQSSKFFYQ